MFVEFQLSHVTKHILFNILILLLSSTTCRGYKGNAKQYTESSRPLQDLSGCDLHRLRQSGEAELDEGAGHPPKVHRAAGPGLLLLTWKGTVIYCQVSKYLLSAGQSC